MILSPLKKACFCVIIGSCLGMTACSTLANFGKNKDDTAAVATQSAHGYYEEAQSAITQEQYAKAIKTLTDLRTFYPTSPYAKQALLDLIFAHYQSGDLEKVTAATTQFLQSYPDADGSDYALYAQGVTHMQGSPKASQLLHLDQSERDTSYLRLAFADFSRLMQNYPNNPYAADVQLRMTHIYNQFAHHELEAAYWYIKRQAYVAAAGRAKWVFQYYPQSTATPEAIALLAYSYDKLGIASSASEYKTLLQINYPHYLQPNGAVRLPHAKINAWQKVLSLVSFGKLGRAALPTNTNSSAYPGPTYTQRIDNISPSLQHHQLPLTLPSDAQSLGTEPLNTPSDNDDFTIDFGLPEAQYTAPHDDPTNLTIGDSGHH